MSGAGSSVWSGAPAWTPDAAARRAGPRPARRRAWLLPLVLLALVGCQAGGVAPVPPAPPGAAAAFVGTARCATCHPREARAHAGSDHARAIQAAGDATVLGDFGDTRFAEGGVAATFFRRGRRFLVRTEGADGKPGEFEIAYTFGVDPLQQYLIPFRAGRLQALGIAWDTRPRAAGGQRWLSLYPGRRFAPGEPLHWTGREQTWNFQCAECHSTDLRKGYDPVADRYATTWAELPVGCEACHGPGATHVAWAEARGAGAAAASTATLPAAGLPVRLGRGAGAWLEDPARGVATWTGAPRTTAEVDACARCHARRQAIVEPYPYGAPLLDTHVPALLDPPLYYPDGQMRGEVYEYGSFLQSRMARAGVTCSDCHDPHAGALRAPGNALCTGCHPAARFDAPAHHRHRAGSEAARCVSCHMAARTYMEVDTRRDHSFRVPRPDLSDALGTPDACTGCHRDRPSAWAAERVATWRRAGAPAPAHFGPALDAGRRGLAGAERALAGLAADARQPAIARATALGMLPEFLGRASAPAVEAALVDPDPLVRMAATAVVEAFPPERRAALAGPRLRDAVRAVRLAAARALTAPPRPPLPEDRRADLDRAVAELVRSELVNAERPEARLNLARLHARLGRPAEAEAEIRAALRLDPRFVPALVARAELLLGQERAPEAEEALAEALRIEPDGAEALHALALLRLRQGRQADGVALLARAVAARPDSVRLRYVYAVALQAAGEVARAVEVLEDAHRRRPADRDVLLALASFLAERGDARAALRYAEMLAALRPEDADVRRLVESLRRRAGPG
jgi:predicted CXXCH cytochrome family protein